AADDDRGFVAGEAVLSKKVFDFFLDELEQVFVIDHVGFIKVDDDIRNADLAGQEDVLAGLGHGAVGGGDDQDRAVHLGGAGDHVFDVVGMARAVDVGVVALLALVLDVGGRDGDAALALLGGVVDLIVRFDLAAVLRRQDLRQRGG